jgi:hypothetical protein
VNVTGSTPPSAITGLVSENVAVLTDDVEAADTIAVALEDEEGSVDDAANAGAADDVGASDDGVDVEEGIVEAQPARSAMATTRRLTSSPRTDP